MLLMAGALTSCGGSDKAVQNDSQAADSVEVAAEPEDTAVVAEAGEKYVPSAIGDCFIGERIRVPNDSGVWCEITFNSDGTCLLKTESESLGGTFTGTVSGDDLKIAVRFSDGQEYDFIGTKTDLVADDGLFKYVVSLEM